MTRITLVAILTNDYVNDLFTREAESFITRQDPKPFFRYELHTRLSLTELARAVNVPGDRRPIPDHPRTESGLVARRHGTLRQSAGTGLRCVSHFRPPSIHVH